MLYQNYGNQFAAIRELFPENTGTVYALSYLANRGDERSAGTLSVSSDMGVLLRRMLNDLEARNTRVVLSHVMKVDTSTTRTKKPHVSISWLAIWTGSTHPSRPGCPAVVPVRKSTRRWCWRASERSSRQNGWTR